jgi:hypothetical protein
VLFRSDIFNQYQSLISLKRDHVEFQYATRTEVDDNVTVDFGSEIGFDDTVMRMVVRGETKTYVVVFVGATSRIRMDLTDHKVLIDTSGTREIGSILEDSHSIYSNTTLVLELTSGGDTSEPPTSEPGTEEPSEGLTPGAIVGISLAGVGAAGGIGALVYFLIKRKKI